MELIFSHKNLTKEQEGQFVDYVNQKMPSIENLLSKFDDDSMLMHVNIEKFDKHDAFQVEMILTIPNKKIVAKEASHHITKSVDLSKDRLVTQLKKHLELTRENRKNQTIRDEEIHSETTNMEI